MKDKIINRVLVGIEDKSYKEKITKYWFFRKIFEGIRKDFYHRRSLNNEKSI